MNMIKGISLGFWVVVFVTPVLSSKETCCKDTWLPYQGSCYMFSDEVKYDWNEAMNYCKGKSADLAAIETENESKFLKFYARKLFKNDHPDRNHTSFWLGATDQDIEGIWKWVSKDEELTYEEWDKSLLQPNLRPDNHEDCLALNGAYDFNWHDGMCRERIGYPLCEMKGSDPSSSSGVDMQLIGRK